MRVLLWIGVVIGWLVVIALSTLGLVALTPRPDTAATSLGTAALTLLWISAISLASVSYWFDSTGSKAARRAILPTRLVGIALLVVGAAVLVGLVVVAGLALWFVVVVVLVAAGLQWAAAPVAHRLGASARRRDADRPWAPVNLAPVRRSRRLAVALGLIVAVVVAGALAVATLSTSDGRYDAGDALMAAFFGLALGGSAAGLTLIFGTIPVGSQIRAVLGGNLVKARRIARVVLRGKGRLEPGEEGDAARYAQLIPSHQANLIGGLLLSELGLTPSLIDDMGRGDVLGWITLTAIAAMLIAAIITLVRNRHAGRYAREHAAAAAPDE